MAKNMDSKFANMYQIPLDLLREGLPSVLRDAADDEVRGGNLVRIATATGLARALSLQSPGDETLKVYLVHYLAPAEAQMIADMVENSKPQSEAGGAATAAALVKAHQAEAGGAAAAAADAAALLMKPQAEAVGAAAAAAGRRFVIVNEQVLHAKQLALMAINGEIADINIIMAEVRAKEQPPYYVAKPPLLDHGLPAGNHLTPLKKAYFASQALAGHFNAAKATLKCIDRALYKSILKSFRMTEVEEKDNLLQLAEEYQQQYKKHNSLGLTEIVKQLLGLLAFVDFEDKKRLLTPADLDGVSNDRSRILKLLKRQKQKFRNLICKQSLIGAEFFDFLRL